ncbi:MAG: AMP-binding protein [Aquamicrobium sp.]|uniref:AMP-binding protein n=1 Tax=Aquamicrobium sp. TaxID=1872579 RepID=UPI00349F02DB|nr:AMP-binding protein [Aquamicrobium sp.]
MFNLTGHLSVNARQRPEAEALVFGGQRLDWRTLEERVLHLAAALSERGVGEGAIVALMMKNSPAFVELIYAISHLGAVVLPLNFRLSADEVDYIANHAGATLLIADDIFEAEASGAKLPTIVLNAAAQADIGAALLDPAGGRRRIVATPRGRDDVFRLMYTSGTTSRPKGVVHTYDNFYWKCFDHVLALGLGETTRLLVVGPLYHVGGSDLPGLGVHLAGGTLVVLRDYEPRAVLEAVAREKIEGVWLAPVMANDILALPEDGLPDTSSLRWCIAGGERTPETRIRAFFERFPSARYIDAYGMTETVSGDTLMEPGREFDRIGSVGRALRFVEIEIRDEAGNRLPPGEEGEICMRGPKVMREYWRDPAKTAETFHADGFMRSGDVGYLDEEGFLYITDRQKDMIISGGENIASSEVERVVYAHPAVREAAVFARPHPRWGEVAVAAIVLAEGQSLTYQQLLDHCRVSLAGFKCPKDMVLLPNLPRNPSGKVLKRTLRELDASGSLNAQEG